MRVAVIPPIPDLTRHATTDIHLLLSHLIERPAYLDHYRKRKALGDYIILDNSAHEHGSGNTSGLLLNQAGLVGADEVVCPDVLFDPIATVKRTERMLERITTTADGYDRYCDAGAPRLMLVPQGTDEPSWAACLKQLMYVWDVYMLDLPDVKPPVIGVSKDYDDDVPGGIAHLIHRYVRPLQRRGIDIHCLGWPSNLWALADVRKRVPWVRSVDSAKPFVYAKAGVQLEPGGPVPPYPHRTDDYFERPLNESEETARINVEVFRAAANDELIA